jgi:hypothetical protein
MKKFDILCLSLIVPIPVILFFGIVYASAILAIHIK